MESLDASDVISSLALAVSFGAFYIAKQRHDLDRKIALTEELTRLHHTFSTEMLVRADPERLQAVRASINKILTYKPDDKVVLCLNALARIMEGNKRVGVLDLANLAEAEPPDHLANCTLATYYFSVAEYEQSKKYGERANSTSNSCTASTTIYIQTLAFLDEHDSAIAVANRFLEAEPSNTNVLTAKAMALHSRGDYPEAREVLDTALKCGGRSSWLFRLYGYCLFQEGDYFAAGRSFDEAIRQDPFDHLSLARLGVVKDILGDPDGGVSLIEESIRIDDTDSISHDAIAPILRKLGRKSEAEYHARRAEELRGSIGRQEP